MNIYKNAFNKRAGSHIMRQTGRISLSFFPARGFITPCKQTRRVYGLPVAAARLFSVVKAPLPRERRCSQSV